MESRAMCRSKRFAKAAHLGEEGQELLGVRAHVSCGRGAHGPVVARRRQQLLAAGAAQLLLHRPVQAVPVRLIGQTVSCQCIDPGTVCVCMSAHSSCDVEHASVGYEGRGAIKGCSSLAS